MSNIRKLESLNKEEALDTLQNAYGIYARDVNNICCIFFIC